MLFCPEISQLALYSACISDVPAPSMINGIKGFACTSTSTRATELVPLDSCQGCNLLELANFSCQFRADYDLQAILCPDSASVELSALIILDLGISCNLDYTRCWIRQLKC